MIVQFYGPHSHRELSCSLSLNCPSDTRDSQALGSVPSPLLSPSPGFQAEAPTQHVFCCADSAGFCICMKRTWNLVDICLLVVGIFFLVLNLLELSGWKGGAAFCLLPRVTGNSSSASLLPWLCLLAEISIFSHAQRKNFLSLLSFGPLPQLYWGIIDK